MPLGVLASPAPSLNVHFDLLEVTSSSVSVCLTEGCVVAAADLIKQMDRRVDPCQNFYKFAKNIMY